jgi:radical SAM protein with 4Fe4S-binding SPASM domain
MTKQCNADCSYCSSWQEKASPMMSVDNFKKSIDYIAADVLPKLLGRPLKTPEPSYASVQYIGGEILLVPPKVLKECVLYAREVFSKIFIGFEDGCQSNLIGSSDKVRALNTLFGRRIGTSVDHFGTQRTIAGSAMRYRDLLAQRRQELLQRRGVVTSAIFVVDHEGVHHAEKEIAKAEQENYHLSLRAIIYGGREVKAASTQQLQDLYRRVYRNWVMKSPIAIEPFVQLLSGRLQEKGAADIGIWGCPFQSNCAQVSLDLEPNGDLFICQDMADTGQFKFGNAIAQSWDQPVWDMLNRRAAHLHSDCRACAYKQTCQGGCMSEAITYQNDPYAKTDLCPIWKTVFAEIDASIAHYGVAALHEWVQTFAYAHDHD